jgi:hypothetical protein
VAEAVSNHLAGRKRRPAGLFYLWQALNYIGAALLQRYKDLDYAGPILQRLKGLPNDAVDHASAYV